MKKLISIMIAIVSIFLLAGCGSNSTTQEQYLRIHIRANSNSRIDQNIKYTIKDDLVNYLTPLVSQCNSFDEVVDMIDDNINDMENLCDNILTDNGFNYTSKIMINEEYFPTRAYGEYVLESDFYDAIIVNLGGAKGDNWWCVVYPPLCFLNAKNVDKNNIVYKSKILELINNFFD